ncbi:MAG: pentapeptide repeat-containing protein [Pleurocapsa sp. MO_226.B13]|nr:pentapeptide repeat-containing protein [Pleurocapsa sp. MO_226.B13]
MDREELLRRYAAGERDFSGLDLSNISPPVSEFSEYFSNNYGLNSCNFRGANFSYVNFSHTFLMYCDFRDTICFRANFTASVFSGTDFTGADLREANLNALEGIGVIFENVDFRGVNRIGNFVDDRTLCLRNCIGGNGEFIELFNEDTVRAEIRAEIRRERNQLGKFHPIPKKRNIDDDAIPF